MLAAAMTDCSRGAPFYRSFGAGRGAGWGFSLAGTLSCILACSEDDSAPQTGTGGLGNDVTGSADAGRQGPGEGYEPTPTFDITNPQRPVPPRSQLVEGVYNLNGGRGSPAGIPSDAGVS